MTSLRSRILIPLIALTGVIFALFGVIAERAVTRELTRGLDEKLLVMAQDVGSAVELLPSGDVEFEPEDIGMSPAEEERDHAFYAIQDASGFMGIASRNTPREELGSVVPAEGEFRRLQVDGLPLRICRHWVERKPEDEAEDGETAPAESFLVTVGVSATNLDATVASFRNDLLLGGAALFVVLTLVPLLVVTGALRGLQRLSREADRIGPEAPGCRLEEEGVGTEVAALVAALNRAVDRLAQAHEREKRFSGDVAHELRTPLSAIRTRCEVALRRPRTTDELRENLQSVLETSKRLGRLVERMLLLSRYQRQGVELSLRETDLSEIARDVMSLHGEEAEKKDISVRMEVGGPVIVQGDEDLLRECVSNLIHNAIRYTPNRGQVTVSTWNGSAAGIVVRDTGVGIEKEHLDKIFDRFYRADPARGGSGSYGLGLCLAQEIARLHGTRIRVESTPGKGSRFEVVFGGDEA